jgi:hypothetical protein
MSKAPEVPVRPRLAANDPGPEHQNICRDADLFVRP